MSFFPQNEYSYKKINIVSFTFELRLSLEVSKEKLHSHDHKAWGCWNQIIGSVGAAEECLCCTLFSYIRGQAESQLWAGQHGTGEATPGHDGAAAEGGRAQSPEGKGRMGTKTERATRARMEETTWMRKTLGEAEGIGATTGRRKEKRDRKTRGYFFLCYFISREIISFNKWLHFIW